MIFDLSPYLSLEGFVTVWVLFIIFCVCLGSD